MKPTIFLPTKKSQAEWRRLHETLADKVRQLLKLQQELELLESYDEAPEGSTHRVGDGEQVTRAAD